MHLLRNAWRQLTSMRTALVLLFLLAVAAIPGSLLPQRSLGIEKVQEYLDEHPSAGPWFDRLSLFDVYSSPWFAAIYLLLFTSLVGCLVPRLRTHFSALFRVPPKAPARLDRLVAHAEIDHDVDPEKVRDLLKRRRFRTVLAEDGTISAEKGYVKETGNLLFHFALLGLLVGVALGGWYGWHGNRIVVVGPERGFCSSLQQFDEYALGARVDGGDLPKFCVTLEEFRASFLDSGQPVSFAADMTFEQGAASGRRSVSVNNPLRLRRANLYLMGHGYAPIMRYTDRSGRTQTSIAPFLARDEFLTSDGVALFPDANAGSSPKAQVGFVGVYLPTVPADPSAERSAHPDERDPRLMLVAYQGDLGLDAGLPRSVYSLDASRVAAGQLVKVGDAQMLRPGESWRLPDGSLVEFLGTRRWAAVSVRYDPGEPVVLSSAILLLGGLMLSLTGRRRRIFFRFGPGSVAVGGLPRSDYTGFATEFDQIIEEVRRI